ncbi:MAG: ribosomal protein S18-alanine N-acetyltransferase [Clostridia bacterium]|nr:ribosomal protein S18-alanine N-acetyltransferase [Clostridia bacterium]
MKTVIFICTGNTCRSPMAEQLYKAYLKSIGEEKTAVYSRGLAADGAPMADHAVTALAELGIAAKGRVSMPLTLPEAQTADLLCVMSQGHKAALQSAGIPEEKILCMNIPDPYGGDMEIYRRCRDAILSGLEKVHLHLFGFVITAFSVQDAPAVAALEQQCFSEPWSEKGITDAYRNGTAFFVAKTDREVVGYAGVQITVDTGYVTNIAVDNRFRGRSIGRALTARLCAACLEKQAESITLEVRPSNWAAVSLYRKLGFAEVGRRRDFYRAPKEDALLMTKNLQGDNQC